MHKVPGSGGQERWLHDNGMPADGGPYDPGAAATLRTIQEQDAQRRRQQDSSGYWEQESKKKKEEESPGPTWINTSTAFEKWLSCFLVSLVLCRFMWHYLDQEILLLFFLVPLVCGCMALYEITQWIKNPEHGRPDPNPTRYIILWYGIILVLTTFTWILWSSWGILAALLATVNALPRRH